MKPVELIGCPSLALSVTASRMGAEPTVKLAVAVAEAAPGFVLVAVMDTL
jgi:hypothetical protein